jgi:hypothetical protein
MYERFEPLSGSRLLLYVRKKVIVASTVSLKLYRVVAPFNETMYVKWASDEPDIQQRQSYSMSTRGSHIRFVFGDGA